MKISAGENHEEAMQPRLHDLEALFAGFADCRKCRAAIPEVAELPDSEFTFHWKPYLNKGNWPLPYVFLAWEPSWPVSEPSDPVPGTFDPRLQFAIREFLMKEQPDAGFLITNMAQCSMRTGAKCDTSREGRFKACSQFLKQQLLLAEKAGMRRT